MLEVPPFGFEDHKQSTVEHNTITSHTLPVTMSRVVHDNLSCKDPAHVKTRLSKNMSGVTCTICKECIYCRPPKRKCWLHHKQVPPSLSLSLPPSSLLPLSLSPFVSSLFLFLFCLSISLFLSLSPSLSLSLSLSPPSFFFPFTPLCASETRVVQR